jgi:hypothetical protein
MSGYLQRMATSVARPSRAVHAVVPGIFAKESSRETGAETGEVETLVETRSESSRTVSSAAQRQRPVEVVEEQLSSVRREEEPMRSRQARSKDEGPPISPRELLVAGWKEPVMPERKAQAAMEMSSEGDRASEERGEVSDEVVKAREQSADVDARAIVPRVKRVEDGAEENVALSVRMERALSPVVIRGDDGRREVEAQRGAERQGAQRDEAKRGGEDIQIHIGRIEVIAVAQPLQRAAPAKVQRGETLEAYLTRHERRSR